MWCTHDPFQINKNEPRLTWICRLLKKKRQGQASRQGQWWIFSQVPESWLSDKRCHLCGYTEECRPSEELCMCSIAKKVIMTPYPEPPSRSGTLNKNKGKNDLTVSYLGAFRCLKLVTIALLKTFLNQGRRRGSRWSTTLQTRKSRINSDAAITFNRPNYEHNF